MSFPPVVITDDGKYPTQNPVALRPGIAMDDSGCTELYDAESFCLAVSITYVLLLIFHGAKRPLACVLCLLSLKLANVDSLQVLSVYVAYFADHRRVEIYDLVVPVILRGQFC